MIPQYISSSLQESGFKDDVDLVVMATKTKILEIIKFIMDVRLDLRITNLLVLYKKQYLELEEEFSGPPCKLSGNIFSYRLCI